MIRIPDLELELERKISDNIFIYTRKKTDIKFLGYKTGDISKNTEAYYLTCLYDKFVLQNFLKENLSIIEILYNAQVIFYITANKNSKESVSVTKIMYSDVDITPDMTQIGDFRIRDKVKIQYLQTHTESHIEEKNIIMSEENEEVDETQEIIMTYMPEIDVLLQEDKIENVIESEDDEDFDLDTEINDDSLDIDIELSDEDFQHEDVNLSRKLKDIGENDY